MISLFFTQLQNVISKVKQSTYASQFYNRFVYDSEGEEITLHYSCGLKGRRHRRKILQEGIDFKAMRIPDAQINRIFQ
jgi:hypothetical protein